MKCGAFEHHRTLLLETNANSNLLFNLLGVVWALSPGGGGLKPEQRADPRSRPHFTDYKYTKYLSSCISPMHDCLSPDPSPVRAPGL